jgi:hypothetical protein
MADKRTLSGRIPEDTYREVEAYADTHDVKKSDVLRRATEEYLDEDDADSGARSPSALTIVGVVALAIAPTLLATGYTALGGGAAVVAVGYIVLWVTGLNVAAERFFGGIREEYTDNGGVVGFFRDVLTVHFGDNWAARQLRKLAGPPVVEDPDTLFERATRADALMYGSMIALLGVLLPVAAAIWFGYFAAFVDFVGATGVDATVLLITFLACSFAVSAGVLALSSLTVASARSAGTTTTDDAADA